MKKKILYLFWIALAVVGIYYGAGFYSKVHQESWPAFERLETSKTLAPIAVVKSTRDFGWRIGDIVPCEYVIKQKPGTVVDIHSLSSEGNFQIVGEPAFEIKDFEDGSRYIRIELQLQSMAIGEQLELKSYILYRDLETNQDHLYEMPVFAVYTSKTWDGRDLVQTGETKLDQLGLVVSTLTYIAGGIIGMVLLIFLNRHLRRKFHVAFLPADFNNRAKKARIRFDATYARIENGDFSEENFLELARIIRELFHLQTAGFSEIAAKLGEAHPFKRHVQRLLMILGEPLYRNRILSRTEVQSIKTAFDQIVPPDKS